jgi:hypothetical protein
MKKLCKEAHGFNLIICAKWGALLVLSTTLEPFE